MKRTLTKLKVKIISQNVWYEKIHRITYWHEIIKWPFYMKSSEVLLEKLLSHKILLNLFNHWKCFPFQFVNLFFPTKGHKYLHLRTWNANWTTKLSPTLVIVSVTMKHYLLFPDKLKILTVTEIRQGTNCLSYLLTKGKRSSHAFASLKCKSSSKAFQRTW